MDRAYAYTVVRSSMSTPDLLDAQDRLNKLGSEGWRVISTAAGGAEWSADRFIVWTLERASALAGTER